MSIDQKLERIELKTFLHGVYDAKETLQAIQIASRNAIRDYEILMTEVDVKLAINGPLYFYRTYAFEPEIGMWLPDGYTYRLKPCTKEELL
jgi:hypothetical protein